MENAEFLGEMLYSNLLNVLNVLKFVSKIKLETISNAIDEIGDKQLTQLKEKLGDEISYTEIKAVINYKNKRPVNF